MELLIRARTLYRDSGLGSWICHHWLRELQDVINLSVSELARRAAPSYFFSVAAFPLELSICVPEVDFQKQESPELGQGDEP